MMKTLYDVLEVNQAASKEAIDGSYNRIFSKYQKQLNNPQVDESELKFKIEALQHAYSILSDISKRHEYDLKLEGKISPSKYHNYTASEAVSNSIFSFFGKPVVLAIILIISVLALLPAIWDKGVSNLGELNENQENNRALDIVDKAATGGLELENKRLDNQVELLRVEQERMEKQLEYEMELRRRQQDRMDRELEYKANAGDRILTIHEKREEQKSKNDEENLRLFESMGNAGSW